MERDGIGSKRMPLDPSRMKRVTTGRLKCVMSALAGALALLCSACAPVMLKAPAGEPSLTCPARSDTIGAR